MKVLRENQVWPIVVECQTCRSLLQIDSTRDLWVGSRSNLTVKCLVCGEVLE